VAGTQTDRRVRRTQQLLRQALFELIEEKGYDRTTVQDILDRADVGRSTFYNHYQTKDQLLLSGLDELHTALTTQLSTDLDSGEGPTPLLAPLRPLFEHIASNRRFSRAMLGSRASTLATRTAYKVLSETLTAHLRARLAIHDQQQLDLAVAFLVSGLLGLLTWWLDTQSDLSADELYTRFERLAAPGIESWDGAEGFSDSRCEVRRLGGRSAQDRTVSTVRTASSGSSLRS
jgi:AcrR family transcriptional regulator